MKSVIFVSCLISMSLGFYDSSALYERRVFSDQIVDLLRRLTEEQVAPPPPEPSSFGCSKDCLEIISTALDVFVGQFKPPYNCDQHSKVSSYNAGVVAELKASHCGIGFQTGYMAQMDSLVLINYPMCKKPEMAAAPAMPKTSIANTPMAPTPQHTAANTGEMSPTTPQQTAPQQTAPQQTAPQQTAGSAAEITPSGTTLPPVETPKPEQRSYKRVFEFLRDLLGDERKK